jgi:hypothetical protein
MRAAGGLVMQKWSGGVPILRRDGPGCCALTEFSATLWPMGGRVTFFPNPDSEEVQSFARAFVRMMFAHAQLEHQIRDLLYVIARDRKLSQRPLKPPGEEMAAWVKKLIEKRARSDAVPEADAICSLLMRAEPLYHDRNLLAHGRWWRFDPMGPGVITVRRGRVFSEDDLGQNFTTEMIDRTASALKDIEAELFMLKSAIENRRTPRHSTNPD